MWAGLFPGQGSQHPGMGKFLFDEFRVAKEIFEEASDTLKIDLKKLCFEGPESDLALTENTQPALLTVSVATAKVLDSLMHIKWRALAGHSVGEYAAVVCAGSLRFADAVIAVRKRGEFMQSAVPVGQGGMLAVLGLDDKDIVHLCEWARQNSGIDGVVEAANFNSPGQIVISGSQPLLNWMKDNITKDIFNPPPAKLRLIPLNVSAPFHCSLMKPAEEKMSLVLNDMEFRQAVIPVVQNVNAEEVSDSATLRENLIAQISSPVRWVECVQNLSTIGCDQAVELGSGKVLSGLVKKIVGETIKIFNLNSLEDLKALEKTAQ